MEFVQKFTPPDFQVKNFTPSILPNFNSFSKKKTQKMSENGEIYTAGKNFTLLPALTGWTNSTSARTLLRFEILRSQYRALHTLHPSLKSQKHYFVQGAERGGAGSVEGGRGGSRSAWTHSARGLRPALIYF